MIIVALSQPELQSAAGLITAGAKSPHTGAEAIMQAAALLAKLQAALEAHIRGDPTMTISKGSHPETAQPLQ